MHTIDDTLFLWHTSPIEVLHSVLNCSSPCDLRCTPGKCLLRTQHDQDRGTREDMYVYVHHSNEPQTRSGGSREIRRCVVYALHQFCSPARSSRNVSLSVEQARHNDFLYHEGMPDIIRFTPLCILALGQVRSAQDPVHYVSRSGLIMYILGTQLVSTMYSPPFHISSHPSRGSVRFVDCSRRPWPNCLTALNIIRGFHVPVSHESLVSLDSLPSSCHRPTDPKLKGAPIPSYSDSFTG